MRTIKDADLKQTVIAKYEYRDKAPQRGIIRTSISADLNRFERQAVAFFLLNKIKREGIKAANSTNYAKVFTSCYE